MAGITPRFQAAYAHLLVDERARVELREDRQALTQRFELSAAELDLLLSLDLGRLALSAEAIAATRVRLLERGLPATLSILQRDPRGKRMLAAFLAECLPTIAGDDQAHNRLLSDVRRLLSYLEARGDAPLPRHIVAVLRHEAEKLELAFSPAAFAAETRSDEQPAAPSGELPLGGRDSHVRVALPPSVRLQRFDYDVIGIAAGADNAMWALPPRRPTHLALKRCVGVMTPQVYRLAPAMYEVLAALDGSTIADTCRRLDDDGAASRAYAKDPLEVLRTAWNRRLVVCSDGRGQD